MLLNVALCKHPFNVKDCHSSFLYFNCYSVLTGNKNICQTINFIFLFQSTEHKSSNIEEGGSGNPSRFTISAPASRLGQGNGLNSGGVVLVHMLPPLGQHPQQ